MPVKQFRSHIALSCVAVSRIQPQWTSPASVFGLVTQMRRSDVRLPALPEPLDIRTPQSGGILASGASCGALKSARHGNFEEVFQLLVCASRRVHVAPRLTQADYFVGGKLNGKLLFFPLFPQKTTNMFSKCSVVLLNALFLVRALSAHECTPCSLRACVAKAPHGCEGGRTLARDPCGCCDQCARLEWEPCGGQDWAHGYCALGLTCASVNGTGAAAIPETGVCKGGWCLFFSE